MPPLEKYRIYDRFPWKMVIHVLLVILTTAQIVLMLIPNGQYSYNQYILWNKLFCNQDASQEDTDVTNSYNLFNMENVLTFVYATIDVISILELLQHK